MVVFWVVIKFGLVAPAMLVQGPVLAGADCHWKVMPVANVFPVKESWKLVPGQTKETELTAVPAVGAPEHGVLGPTSIPKSWKI